MDDLYVLYLMVALLERPLLMSRLAAILVEIDANDLNNVLACRHYIIFKIGDFLSFSMKFCHDLGRPNNYLMKLRGLQGDLFVW